MGDWSAYNLITTNGSQDGLCKAMEMLLGERAGVNLGCYDFHVRSFPSPDPGDHVITEDYTYLSIPTMVNPLGARYVVVEGDQGGMRPDRLWEGLRKR